MATNLSIWDPRWFVDGNANAALDSDFGFDDKFVDNVVVVVAVVAIDDRCCYENRNASVDSFYSKTNWKIKIIKIWHKVQSK